MSRRPRDINVEAAGESSGDSCHSSASSESSSFVASDRQARSPRGIPAFRRRGIKRGPFSTDSFASSENGKAKTGRPRSCLGRMTHRQVIRAHNLVARHCPLLLNRMCNVFLFVGLIFWMITAFSTLEQTTETQPSQSKHHTLRKPVPKRPSMIESALNSLTGPKKRKRHEADLPGCVRPDWQKFSFPTCNDVHDIDLKKFILRGMRQEPKKVGYVSSGLWRSVFAIAAKDERELSVLKMMKTKHDLTTRNFDRHRRDAIAMERLSGNPNVVDIYGFCGNSVLTEYAPRTVDDLIYESSYIWKSNNQNVLATRKTPGGRLELALGVMKGLASLHEIDGGPIVHADITAKQFLISDTGDIKVNDFNRCRFMAHSETSGQPCKFVIPTAPGKNRSPEEYKEHDLSEKLDVYSAGNILYGILTGTRAWYQSGSSETKKYVMKGAMPYIPDKLRKPNTLDAALANLTELAFENDPDQRISARQLVGELEGLRHRFLPTAP